MWCELKVIMANSTLTEGPNLGCVEGRERLYSMQTVVIQHGYETTWVRWSCTPILMLVLQLGKCGLQWKLKVCSTETEGKLAFIEKSACSWSLSSLFSCK